MIKIHQIKIYINLKITCLSFMFFLIKYNFLQFIWLQNKSQTDQTVKSKMKYFSEFVINNKVSFLINNLAFSQPKIFKFFNL